MQSQGQGGSSDHQHEEHEEQAEQPQDIVDDSETYDQNANEQEENFAEHDANQLAADAGPDDEMKPER